MIIGIYARAETPDAIVDRIAAESAQIAREPEIIQRLTVLGVEAIGSGRQAFTTALQEETKRVGALIEEAGLKMK